MPGRIIACEYALPITKYENSDFYAEFPEVKSGNLEKTGVLNRHIAGLNESASELACAAAKQLISKHEIDPHSIDFLLFMSADLDYYTPSTAGILHHKLGLRRDAGALDITQGCSGYIYALHIANSLLKANGYKRVLVLTASFLTKKIHPLDKGNRFLFGDAASATLLENSDSDGLMRFVFGNDGSRFDKIIIRNGREKHPIVQNPPTSTDEFGNVTSPNHFFMDGLAVFRFSVSTIPGLINEICESNGVQQQDIDLFIFHQPNRYLNEVLIKKIGIPEEKFLHAAAHYGNTVQNTIPIAIHDAAESGKLRRGMKVLLCGFGTGLSWGATILTY